MDTRIVGVIVFVAAPALGQPLVEFRAKIGIPVSEAFQTNCICFRYGSVGDSATRRYTAGAGAVFRLPHHFGAEVNILYKRLGYDVRGASFVVPVIHYHTRTSANSWEFPMLGVYRPPRLLHLALRTSVGVSFRGVSGEVSTVQCVPDAVVYSSFCGAYPGPRPTRDWRLGLRSSFGGGFGVGMETRVGRTRLTPEIRYTRWRADAGDDGGPMFDVRSNRNQIDFLLGIGF